MGQVMAGHSFYGLFSIEKFFEFFLNFSFRKKIITQISTKNVIFSSELEIWLV